MRSKLPENKPLIEEFLKVTTLAHNIPLNFSLENCQINLIQKETSIAQELEIQNLVNKILAI